MQSSRVPTILVPESQMQTQNQALFYAKEKNYFLQQLSQKMEIETRLPTVDLRRNMRIDYYIDQYN